MNATVSVIVPCYNAVAFLPGLLASIRAQTHPVHEVIIVDDGSTDDTSAYCQSLEDFQSFGESIRIFRQDNAGPGAARNYGIAEATGEYIAFLDVDDRWPEEKLEVQIARFQQEPELMIVNGRVRYVFDPEASQPDRRGLDGNTAIVNVHLGSGLYRRQVFAEIGTFDTSFHWHEDQDWWFRFRESGQRMVILDTITLYYHLHGSNMTNSIDLVETGLLRAMKRSLDRRRAQGRQGQLPQMSDFLDKTDRMIDHG